VLLEIKLELGERDHRVALQKGRRVGRRGGRERATGDQARVGGERDHRVALQKGRRVGRRRGIERATGDQANVGRERDHRVALQKQERHEDGAERVNSRGQRV